MLRLLVVDDDRLITDETAKFFRARNWDVVTAYHIQSALEAIDHNFDAVLLDIQLPAAEGTREIVLDGGERIFAELNKRPEFDSMCVIMMTQYGTIESAIRCLRAGAYHYVDKEVALEDLRRLLVAGIAKQKADLLRTEILGNFDVDSLVAKTSAILSETLAPDGVYFISLDSAGMIRDIRSGPSSTIRAPDELSARWHV